MCVLFTFFEYYHSCVKIFRTLIKNVISAMKYQNHILFIEDYAIIMY